MFCFVFLNLALQQEEETALEMEEMGYRKWCTFVRKKKKKERSSDSWNGWWAFRQPFLHCSLQICDDFIAFFTSVFANGDGGVRLPLASTTY